LLAEDGGALTGTLTSFHGELEQLLGDTFDADSKSSVLANIEQLVLSTMKGLITPEIADSPIGRLKAELVETVQREVGEIAEEVRRVTDHLGILEATDDVYEQTTAKGFDYEDLVDECVATLAAGYGDLAEVTAKQSGSNASHVGDEVVTLNRDDTHGLEARFTLEMKNRALNMRKTMAELDEARCNRDALAAIAVFRSQDQAPTAVPFQHFDDKAIVVFDPDDEDDSALRLAYMWARWTVRKGLAVNEEAEVDLERVRCLLDEASRALERHTSIKRFHTQARKSIDQAADQVRDLVDEVHESLESLDAELRA
jgi:predicted transcriptional regulator